ncbi:hypothetical protein J2858_001746 [Neorhizobium galegae]|uniref:SH3 domain-containing protein n=1 Tax=Neorhizobium galegae TaxID=399 RepID=UPI001AE6F94E|nr:SH3 domain-containing protein [Neorhizobium galegae]MBP2548830.1 hypothetical protein [Neorhizobium galegae]
MPMKTLSIELTLIISIMASGIVPLFPLLNRKDITFSRRLIYIILSIPIVIFTVYTLVKTIRLEIFGQDMPKFCEFVSLPTCGDATGGDSKALSSQYLPSIGLTSVEICGRALAADRRSWSNDTSQLTFVNKSKETGETIDTCRLKLGMKSVSEADKEQELSVLRALSNAQLCRYAYDNSSMKFTEADNYKKYSLETLSRGLSIEDCKRILGVYQPIQNTGSEREAENNLGDGSGVPKAESHQLDSRSGLPISYVLNKSGNSSNLRSGPGKTFPAIMRLPNNIEVVILGSSTSATGYVWCEVSLSSGKRGFLSSDLVAHSCELSPTQIQNAIRTQEAQREQTQQLANGLLGIIGSIVKK